MDRNFIYRVAGRATAPGELPPRLRISLGAALSEQAAALGDKPFVTFTSFPPSPDTDVTLSYRDVDEGSNRLARGLAALGVTRGSYVAVMLPNCQEFLLSSYALKKLGAVEVAVNGEFRGASLARMITMTGAPIVITTGAGAERLARLRSDLPDLRVAVVTDQAEPIAPAGLESRAFGSIVSSDASALDVAPPRDSDPASIMFTSGSTGPSKGVLLSHRWAVRCAEAVLGIVGGVDETDVVYTFYPLFNAASPYCEVLPALLTGGRAVVTPRFSASRFWDEVRRHRATWFLMQGTVSRILWERPPTAEDRDHSVKVAWATPLVGDREAYEQRFGIRIVCDDAYGSTEANMLRPRLPGTDGRDRVSHEVAIVDENDDELPQGETGEIVIRSLEPDVMFKGYFGQPEETLAACRNLWYHSGDMGRIDADGRLHFVGRASERIRSRGKMVSSLEIEEALLGHPGVAESAVIGVPSDMGEDDILAFVTATAAPAPSEGELIAHCRDQLPPYMVPRSVRLLAEIPVTPTGKVAKGTLRELAAKR